MSAGEIRAWAALRQLRKAGVHVVRQHKIGRYTVDFAVRSARLAVEIDGAVHALPGRAEYDAQRQAHLERKGWRFVRIASEATHDQKAIIEAVLAQLPLPLRGGGRGWGAPPASTALSTPRAHKTEAPTPNSACGVASPRPQSPSPQGEGAFAPHLQRRTRTNRTLPPRRKA